jgi:hypothetical protein
MVPTKKILVLLWVLVFVTLTLYGFAMLTNAADHTVLEITIPTDITQML